jgi:hypothetical protein
VEGIEGCSYTTELERNTPDLNYFWKSKARGHEYASAALVEQIEYMKQPQNTL